MKSAVIGVGRMGRRHVMSLQKLNIELIAVVDSNPESLKLASKECEVGPELLFDNVEAMFEKTHPELVTVATTADSHLKLVSLSAELGAKYILCEKPMGVSLDECDRMISVCEKFGVKLAINHQMRFMDQYIKAKEIMNSEEIGGLSSVNVTAGNFGMSMNGAHYFEMFRFLSDEMPVEVSAWFSNEIIKNPRGEQYSDSAGSIRMVSSSGKRMYMDIGSDQGHGLRIMLAGPFGQLMVDELAGNMNMTFREKKYRELPSTRYGLPWIEETREFKREDTLEWTRSVLKALMNGENVPSGEEGRSAVATLVAAYHSNENGHISVQINGGVLPRDRIFPWA
jgi:predicted dehydrogenase